MADGSAAQQVLSQAPSSRQYYLRLLRNPPVRLRFYIVEVPLQDSALREVRYLLNAFALDRPHHYAVSRHDRFSELHAVRWRAHGASCPEFI